jgi:hypothetical protein
MLVLLVIYLFSCLVTLALRSLWHLNQQALWLAANNGEASALALFVARVALANHHDVAVATNHAALFTDGLDAGVDLHLFLFSLSSIRFRSLETSRYFPAALLVAVDDPAAGQVVWAQFYDHAVLRKDSDVVLTHLPRDVGKYSVSVGQLNAKHCVGQSFDHCAFDLDDTVFFGHCLFVAISDYWSCVDLCQLALRA